MKAGAANLAELSSRDRREVRRAVRYGRAVDDPGLAPVAIAEAQRVQLAAARWTRRTPGGWPSLAAACIRGEAWILAVPALLVAVWIPDAAAIGVEVFTLFVLVQLIVRWAKNAPVLAAQSEAANRALLGERVEPPPPPTRLPWWRSRRGVPSSKPEVTAWLPIPLRQLVPIWLGWAAAVLVVGIVGPTWTQWLIPFVYVVGWVEVERRLAEPVEERLRPGRREGGACLRRLPFGTRLEAQLRVAAPIRRRDRRLGAGRPHRLVPRPRGRRRLRPRAAPDLRLPRPRQPPPLAAPPPVSIV